METQPTAFSALLEAAREVSMVADAADLQALMKSVLERALGLAGAERGVLILVEDGQTRIAASQFAQGSEEGDLELSQTLLNRVIQQGEAILTTNAQEDPRFGSQASIMALSIRSVLAVPLRTASRVLGALYLDTRFTTRIFDRPELELLQAFAGLTASALSLVAREEKLKREVAELRIEIDEARRQSQISEIVDTGFFQDLKARAAQLRAQKKRPTGDTEND